MDIGVYAQQFNKIIRSCCSSCQQPDSYFLNIDIPASANGRIRDVSEVRLPQHVLDCLNNPPAGKRAVWILVQITWEFAEWAHAVLLMFDLRKRLQIVFDPETCITIPATSHDLQQYQLHPQYAAVPLEGMLPVLERDCLQERAQQRMHADEWGVCGVMCTLVALCCIRFNYYNPYDMAQLLGSCIPYKSRCNQLITWYEDLIRIHTTAGILQHILPAPSSSQVSTTCSAFCTTTNKLCNRKPCRVGNKSCFCWQHRYLGINTNAPNRRCMTAQVPCDARGY
jgi:hypothetical protein